jgi:NitT/TauT family transport system ATP-binding protein
LRHCPRAGITATCVASIEATAQRSATGRVHKEHPHAIRARHRSVKQAGATVTLQDAPPVTSAAQPELGQPRIRVQGLCKRYGTLEVFRDIEFDVGEREIVAVVGPSGCGKTTLLRCIDGLIPFDAGNVTVGHESVTGPIAGMAMVFQHFGLFPWKTVFDNVAYGLRMAGASKAEVERKVPVFIKMVGLAGFEKAFPYQMSGGMQQRCGLARALAVEPNVLLMDEPFAAVDAQTREILQFELLRIWEERPTAMIFVTHSIEEAVLLGHRVIVLKGRPSSIHETIPIDLPNPRTRDTLRLARFAELRERVWSTLMREARAAEFELQA